MKGDAKFKGKLTFGLKNNIRNLINFHASSRKWKFALWSDPFVQSIYRFRWKNTEELCFMTLKSDAKFEEKLTLGSKSEMKNLVNFYPTSQMHENFISIGYFYPKYMRFELNKYNGVIFYATEPWRKIWINPDLVVSKMA